MKLPYLSNTPVTTHGQMSEPAYVYSRVELLDADADPEEAERQQKARRRRIEHSGRLVGRNPEKLLRRLDRREDNLRALTATDPLRASALQVSKSSATG